MIKGNLTIVKKLTPDKNRRTRYSCICVCGKTVIRNSEYLRKSPVLSCGCTDPRRNPDRELTMLRKLYPNMTNRKNLDHNLTLEQFVKIIKQPCNYCGTPYSRVIEDKDGRGKYISNTILKINGIDRVDNSKGYLAGNCVSCCGTCNLAKRNMSKQEFLDWIKKVYLFNI